MASAKSGLARHRMEGSFRFALSNSSDRQKSWKRNPPAFQQHAVEILPKREIEVTIWEHRKPARATMQGR